MVEQTVFGEKDLLDVQTHDDLINHARIFSLDSLRFFQYMVFNGIRSAIRGEG